MAFIEYNLNQADGSPDPAGFEKVEGNWWFTSGYYRCAANIRSELKIIDASYDNDVTMDLIRLTSSSPKQFRYEFRRIDSDNTLVVYFDFKYEGIVLAIVEEGQETVIQNGTIPKGNAVIRVKTLGESIQVYRNGNMVIDATDNRNRYVNGTAIVTPSGFYGMNSISFSTREPQDNLAPLAVLGEDRGVYLDFEYTADLSGSNDPNGDTLSYSTTLSKPSGSTSVLTDENTVSPKFTPDVAGDYVLTSTVSDSYGGTSTTTQTISARASKVKPLSLPQTIQGFTRRGIKLGRITSHSQMDSSDVEYWPFPLDGSKVPNWPYERYPILLYTTTDHDQNGAGGVYLRVWDRDLGELATLVDGKLVLNEAALVEWQDVSNRAEFSHISTKTNPIFWDSQGFQTETATLLPMDNGEIFMYYHNQGVELNNEKYSSKSYQVTRRTVSTNGVDFSGRFDLGTAYNAYVRKGDGHNGYGRFGPNTIRGINANYVGRVLSGGGGLNRNSGLQYVMSNDAKSWDLISMGSLQTGFLKDDPAFEGEVLLSIATIDNAIPEGPYYRVDGLVKVRSFGTQNGQGFPVEVLINDDLQVVSYTSTIMSKGESGTYDDFELGGIFTVEVDGKTYAFYKATQSNNTRTIGVALIEEMPHEWTIAQPLSEKVSIAEYVTTETLPLQGFTYSSAPTSIPVHEGGEFPTGFLTAIPLPSSGEAGTMLSNNTVDLADYDMVDVRFELIGKAGGLPQTLEFGLVDNLDNPTHKLSIKFPLSESTSSSRSEPMLFQALGSLDESEHPLSIYVGQSNNWRNNDYDESPQAKFYLGFRVIPAQKKVIFLDGASVIETIDVEGFDFETLLHVYGKGALDVSAGQDSEWHVGNIRLNGFSGNAVAVPVAPTLTASKSSDSVTLTTNSVSGATGYKYFLDNQSNDTGVFTGLEPETTYTVYARASNALGDSSPSTIQTLTTDAAGTPDTTAPVVTNNGPATLTLTVGDSYTPDFSTNEGTLNISNPVDTSTAGTYTVTATATDAAGNVGSATQTVIVEEVPVNQPPVANAGPDQSVAAGVRVQLNASMSTDPEDGSISQFGWEQVDNGADAVVLEFANTATPEFTAPSSLTAQTLEFRVQAQDSEGATATDTVTVQVAALQENEILSTMETLDFELVTQGNLVAYKGRSNREVMQLKPSSLTGIVTAGGYLDLTQNGIAKIEVIADGKKISNENSDSIKIDGSKILARLGDLDIPTGGRDSIQPTFMIVLYVGSDTRGLVVASNATSGYKPLSYRVEEIA